MSLLNPWPALALALLAIPLLVALYMLKLRRRRLNIASTMLWTRTFEDLQANTPFQRLRWSLLFLLHLALLTLLLLAFAEPVTQTDAAASARTILIVDRSASMNTLAGGGSGQGTRLEAAKETAAAMIERLTDRTTRSQVMLIAMAARSQVVSGFETDADLLGSRLDAIEPTDETANLQSALDLAGAYAMDHQESGQLPVDVVLLSDGGVRLPEDGRSHRLRAGNFRFIQVAEADSDDNFGFTAINARRDDRDPTRVRVFARMAGTADSPSTLTASVFVDDKPMAIRQVEVTGSTPAEIGEATISELIEMPAGGVVRVQHSVRDALESDNVAAVVVPPPRKPRIALVHAMDEEPDAFLEKVLTEMQPRFLRRLSTPAFDQIEASRLDAGDILDFVVFDRTSPARLPGVPSLTIGATPPGVATLEPAISGAQRILTWERRHPLMRDVSLDGVRFADFGAYQLENSGVSLASGAQGPIIGLIESNGAAHALIGFSLDKSNWPINISFLIFLQNLVDSVELQGVSRQGIAYQAGESIALRAAADATEITISGPEFTRSIDAEPGRTIDVPGISRAGLYGLTGVAGDLAHLAINVASLRESDARPTDSITVNSQSTQSATLDATTSKPLWRWLILIAAGLLVAEWLIYCRRLLG